MKTKLTTIAILLAAFTANAQECTYTVTYDQNGRPVITKDINCRVGDAEQKADEAMNLAGDAESKAEVAKDIANNANDKAAAALEQGNLNSSGIKANAIVIEQNRQNIVEQGGAIKNHAQVINNHAQAINGLNKNFQSLAKQVKENRKRAAGGVAGVMAAANIPQVHVGSNHALGLGYGGFDGEQAVAVGYSGRINQHVITKATVSYTTNGNFVGGAGVAFNW